ncbi:MarR family winged helix-turn-helix transcriptional regulator [Sphingomonas asaccharolytica]|uniref:MarR family winged helix-turn-helix transcriptional regulator n=1 Tax=Sphingomonas asaccharolytica TaxID=40681 RepID=UPI000829C45B|nr:MarR family transcriptional regulator [Sphingomonas asaccharolytica]
MKQGSDLDGLLGYRIELAHLIAIEDARLMLAPYGLTPAKLTALLLIRANPGCDQTALGKALSVNRSSAMKLVNVLVDRGLIERRPGRDLRTNALHLLPDGEKRVAEMLDQLRESDRRLAADLTAAERATLMALLKKLRKPRAARRDDD